MSLSRAPAASVPPVRGTYAAYVPRLLDDPWDGARIVAASVVFCDLAWISATTDRKRDANQFVGRLNGALSDLIAAAESHGGDVLSFSSDAITLLFTGEGRQGRAINAVHAMHDIAANAHGVLSMSAGIASGVVHLITAGDKPRHLIAAGPTITRALELQALAGPGDTRAETVDRSAIETPGRTTARPAGTFIAPAVRDLIDAKQTDPDYRQATIGFGIFSGVDRALQRNPAKAARQIGEVVEAVHRAAAEHGVTALGVDPARDGGRFTLSTELAVPNQDGEERMIRFAKAVVGGDPPFALRFGIATGEVLAGIFGGPTRGTYAAAGPTVDLAARLAASASPGEVLTTHRAIDRATTRYAISEWDPVTFTGLDAQVVPVVVGSELSDEGGRGAGGLVGRTEEQATLGRLIDELQSGRGGVAEIVGDAGIGKSRLVSESLRDSDATTVVVRGEEYRRAMPYGAASRLLRAAMGIDEHEDPKRAGVLVRAQVRELTPYLEPLLPLIAEVAEAEVEPTAAVDELSVAFHRERTQWAVSQLSVWLTRRPIVVQIEDAHWIDAASADLLSYVLARGADLPWLVITTRRSGDSGWVAGDELHPTRIDLEPLAPGASRALLTELRRDDPLPPDLTSDLIEHSGGNPYLLERLAAAAGWADHLPGNVEAAAAIQLDHLETLPSERYCSIWPC
jgi:class 3 adenylate cyclase